MAKETFGIGMHGQDTPIETSVPGTSVPGTQRIKRAEKRKQNKKLDKWLDTIFESPKAKKNLFRKRERPSVDPSCSISTIHNDSYQVE